MPHDEWMVRAGKVAGVAAEFAAQAEHDRRLPTPVVDMIRSTGIPGLGLPRALGGHAGSPLTTMAVLESVARSDAAAAWVCMIASTGALLGAYLPQAAGRIVFGHGDGTMTAGVFAPKGTALRQADGYLLTGRWPFGSGSLHAEWISAGARVADRAVLQSGAPDVVTMFMPADAVEILTGTWDVVGLGATGSHDFVVDGLFVPEEFAVSLFTTEPWTDEPLFRFPVFGMLALGVASVLVGTARGAIDDVADLAGRKTPTSSRRKLAERPATQSVIARATARLDAAWCLMTERIGEAWQAAERDGEIAVEGRAGLRMAATHAAEVAVEVVDSMYSIAGGTAIYSSFPLSHRFRDVHTGAQHMMVAAPTYELIGKVLLGMDPDTSSL